MNVVLDQKNYIEELNCHLKYVFCLVFKYYLVINSIFFRATVANLESKVETLTTSNTLIKEELDMSKTSLATLKEENELLKKQLNRHDDSKDVDIFFSF